MSDDLFKLNRGQIARLNNLMRDYTPTGFDQELKAAIFEQFVDEFDLLIYVFQDDNRISTRDKAGIEVLGVELDWRLSQIQKSEHLARVNPGTNGKVKTVTTISDGPSGKELNSSAVRFSDLPLQLQVTTVTTAQQRAEKAMEGKSEIEMLCYIESLKIEFEKCNDIARAKNIQGFRQSIDRSNKSHFVKKVTKIRKKRDKENTIKTTVKGVKEEFVLIPQPFNEDLSKAEIKLMKNLLGLNPNNEKDCNEYKATRPS